MDVLPMAAAAVSWVRAYYGAVQRATGVPQPFDAVTQGRFDPDAPPAGRVDLGWIDGFTRTSTSEIVPMLGGAVTALRGQMRKQVSAEVALQFLQWGKLQMGLSAGGQEMNLLALGAAIAINAGSTATALQVSDASGFAAGDIVVVDSDYVGETGYVGAGVSAGYVVSADAVNSDTEYVRRVSFNVGRVASVSGNVLTLAKPLPGGAPADGMKVAKVLGFTDREGGGFFHEWSGLFVADGVEGDRVVFYYPRLQSAVGAAEKETVLAREWKEMRMAARFRALPVRDPVDGEMVVCFRTYLPAPMREV